MTTPPDAVLADMEAARAALRKLLEHGEAAIGYTLSSVCNETLVWIKGRERWMQEKSNAPAR